MLAHRLRHRIRFEQPVEDQDATTGAVTACWETAWLGTKPLDDVPAEVLTGPGREVAQDGTKLAEVAARINLRWFPGLSAKWRIVWDNRIFTIASIDTDATGRFEYRLKCAEGISDGG